MRGREREERGEGGRGSVRGREREERGGGERQREREEMGQRGRKKFVKKDIEEPKERPGSKVMGWGRDDWAEWGQEK
jgi:hypothetical protein